MSAENVQAVKEALEQHLEDVKAVIGQETAAEKISFIQYKSKVDALVSEIALTEGLFGEIDQGPEEEERPER